MPTITTTVTSAAASGVVTTQTTTEATAEPAAVSTPEPVAAAPAPAVVLKDGHAVNESHHVKVGIPADPEGVTKEWMTAALQSRGIIARSTTVTAIDAKQIGEGRGYANYTILAKLTYSRPQHPDVPTAVCVKIANQTFQEFMLDGKPPHIWKFMNDFYVCEANFYSDYRANMTVPCCKYYWSEIVYPADPGTEFGSYGLMIEYLGDDLKMYDVNKGVTTVDMIDALETVAKVHASSWNDDYCENVQSGGTNFYFNDSDSMGRLMQSFGEQGWESYCASLDAEIGQTKPEIVAGVRRAFATLPKWTNVSLSGNKTLTSVDLRAENLIWRKTPSGPKEYECVPIDHQGWWYGPPAKDVAMLMFTSMEKDRIGPDMQKCCRAYYASLCDAGVNDYSYEMFRKELAIGAWSVLIFAGCFVETIDGLRAAVSTMDKADPAYAETSTMLTNVTQLMNDFKEKALISIDALGQDCMDALDFIDSASK